MQTGAPPDLDWRDTTPVSRAFADPYFAAGQGLAETEHVFLAGNRLEDRLDTGMDEGGGLGGGFHIAELGIGTGLNLLAAWRLARTKGIALRYTGFEAFPMSQSDLARALAAFPELANLAAPWVADWTGASRRFRAEGLEAELVIGDARATVPAWDGRADAWFLDGFAPARNPQLWEPALLAEVFAHTAPGGTFATYTAAGAVRRALETAGFAVTRVPGFGRKRHMTVGTRP